MYIFIYMYVYLCVCVCSMHVLCICSYVCMYILISFCFLYFLSIYKARLPSRYNFVHYYHVFTIIILHLNLAKSAYKYL